MELYLRRTLVRLDYLFSFYLSADVSEGQLNRFPYMVVYELFDTTIVIYSVFMAKQDPAKKEHYSLMGRKLIRWFITFHRNVWCGKQSLPPMAGFLRNGKCFTLFNLPTNCSNGAKANFLNKCIGVNNDLRFDLRFDKKLHRIFQQYKCATQGCCHENICRAQKNLLKNYRRSQILNWLIYPRYAFKALL